MGTAATEKNTGATEIIFEFAETEADQRPLADGFLTSLDLVSRDKSHVGLPTRVQDVKRVHCARLTRTQWNGT